MSIEDLYASTTLDTSPASDSAFEPLDASDDFEMDAWDKEHTPIRWLFAKKGRAALVEFGVTELAAGSPVYMNKSELAEQAGVSRHSAIRHIESLVELGIYETLDRGKVQRYRPNPNSRILHVLGSANEEISDVV